MKIDIIIDILSGYGSEKGFDFVISKVRELSKKRILKDHIKELIRLELSAFENTDKDGEYDFQGLIDLLKEFGNESFIESYVYAYIEYDSLEIKKELIRKECIRDTNANNQPCEQFLLPYKHLYSGENKRHYILQYSAKILVAAAGFEPTTFGL